jgi:hypothetical protein
LEAASDGADDEGLAGGLDDFLGDGAELVDFQDAVDLGDEPAGQAEVPAGDAVDGGDSLGGGVTVWGVQVQVRPLPGQDERLLSGVPQTHTPEIGETLRLARAKC